GHRSRAAEPRSRADGTARLSGERRGRCSAHGWGSGAATRDLGAGASGGRSGGSRRGGRGVGAMRRTLLILALMLVAGGLLGGAGRLAGGAVLQTATARRGRAAGAAGAAGGAGGVAAAGGGLWRSGRWRRRGGRCPAGRRCIHPASWCPPRARRRGRRAVARG